MGIGYIRTRYANEVGILMGLITEFTGSRPNWAARGFTYRTFLQFWWTREGRGKEQFDSLPDLIVPIVKAYVNHGCWVADCPEPGCGGAEDVDSSWPWLICWRCGGGKWPIRFPGKSKHQNIESILSKRPLLKGPDGRKHFNWYARESLDDLRKQNADHGVD